MIIFKGFHRGGGGGVGIFILLIIASSYLSKLRKAYFYLFATFISWQIGRVAGFGLGKDRLKKRGEEERRGLQPRRKVSFIKCRLNYLLHVECRGLGMEKTG